MTISVLRTADAWWLKTEAGAAKIDTTATTTAALLSTGRRSTPPPPRMPSRSTISTLLSPVTRPCRVVAQMTNFESHVKDAGMDPASVPLTFFRKASASINGPFDDIVKPPHVQLLDYEVEIGLVIGRAIPVGTTISETNLAEFIAGLVVTNDVSARDVQLPQTQFYEAKSYPTFTPVGPELVLLTAEELRRFGDLRLRLNVGGVERQNALVDGDMLYRPLQALQSLTQFQELAPGDLIAHRHPGRHRAERPAQAAGDDRKPVADESQMEGVFQSSSRQPEVSSARRHRRGVGSHRRRTHRPRNSAQYRPIRMSATAIRRVPVVIVGAGPTGITAATLLAQYGVDSMLLDRWHGVYPQPRAVHLDDEIYRVIARLGIAEEFAAISRPTLGLRLLDDRFRVLAEFTRDASRSRNGFPQANMFDQPELEALLRANLKRYPHAQLRGDAEVTDVTDTGTHVRITFTDRCRWHGSSGRCRLSAGLRRRQQHGAHPNGLGHKRFELQAALAGRRRRHRRRPPAVGRRAPGM